MADLDPRFICTSDLDTYYVDNASGLPLSGGIVTFYSDINRTVLKPVYQLTGTPGNYTYAPLNNPCTLSSAGTFQDAIGNNIVPYYYPFTGLPSDNTGIQELYYVTVVNSGFVPQFVRQGWPQAAGSSVVPVSDEEVDNFIPNGQFLSHNNIVSITEPPVTQYAYGSQTVDSQAIAQGGWNFVYTDGTSATFNNSFSQIPSSGGWGINSFPKYIFNFVCTSFNANALTRDLRIQWPDVNKFSSGNPPGTTPYTLFFDGKSNDGNTYVFNLYKIYFFGTAGNGGAPGSPIEELVGQITIGPGATFVSHNINNIIFSVNGGTIGANGDDYVALSLRGPSSGWNISVSDFVLAQGTETFTSFPVQTNDQMLSRGVAGWMPTPNPDGSDLYLPLVLTPQGMTWDHSQVGMIESSMEQGSSPVHPTSNLLMCDGAQYLTSDYSPLGIPFSRLQKFLFANGLGTSIMVPIFGTGANYATTYVSNGLATQLLLITNKAGLQTVPADGTAATGFTFGPTVKLGSSGIGFNGYSNVDGYVTATSSPFLTPALASAGAGTSGFTVTEINNSSSTGLIYNIEVLTVAAAGLAGLYWLFSSNSVNYYMWFTVNGSGADPAVGGRTGINVALKSTMSVRDVAMTVAATIAAQQTDIVTIVTLPPASSYFTFNANSLKYVVWYKIDGAGTQPVVAGTAKYIEVDLLSTDTAAQATTKTQIAINSLYFAVPDLRGVFLRGGTTDLNSGGKWDMSVISRFSSAFNINGSNVGTFELDTYASHVHQITTTQGGAVTNTSASGGGAAVGSVFTDFSGQAETRPVNVFVNFLIRY